MRKYLFPVLMVLLCLPAALQAQILQPVTWQMSAEKTGTNEYTLIYKASIEEGWKVYAVDIEEGGPVPTSVNYEGIPDGLTMQGELQQLGRKEEAVEPLFDNMLLKFFHKRVTLRQVVTITQDVTLKGYVEFMSCDDRQCLAPEAAEFEFKLVADDTAGGDETSTHDGILTPVKWKVYSEKIDDTNYYIYFDASIDNGWKLYSQNIEPGGPVPTSFKFKNEGSGYSLTGQVEEVTKPEQKKEPLFDNMMLRYFKHHAQFRQHITLTDTAAVVKGSYTFMTCDASQCLPAEEVDFAIDLRSGLIVAAEDPAEDTLEVAEADFGINTTPLNSCVEGAGEVISDPEHKNRGFTGIFLLGFVGGLLALLTPCVFPMIPLTVSFFTKRSQSKSKGVFEAFFYGFCIILIYALLALPFVIYKLPPDTLNAISTNIYLNIAFFVVFLAFAFSFFGYYELTLPSSWLNKADSASNVGGLVGIFFMALTLALVSFSCTGPILGSLLVGSLSAEGGQMNLMAGMIGFGAALALPFGLFAAFPQFMNKLPKSGGWLNSVKVVLGFLEVALAFKFFSNADLVAHFGILKREIFFIIWTLCGIGIVIYLLGWIKFPHDSPGKVKIGPARATFGILFLALSVHFGGGIIKGGNPFLASGFAPPMFYSIYPQDTHCPLGLDCFHDFDEAVAYAQQVNKPVMVDFTGWACVNCRKMEEHVWPEDEVYKLISEEYVLVSLYVDDKEMLPADEQYVSAFSGKKIRTIGNKWSDFQSSYFGVNSQPYYVLISPNGQVLNTPVPYTPDVQEYASFLECGLSTFREATQVAEK